MSGARIMLSLVAMCLQFISTQSYIRSSVFTRPLTQLKAVETGDFLPKGLTVDLVSMSSPTATFASFQEHVDIGEIIKGHKKAVIFALPGAYSPLCSARHLSGFVKSAAAIYKKGVDAIYCIAVNDKYVLKAWGEDTPNWKTSGIQMVADGNAHFVKAVGYVKDVSGVRMGTRSRRWAAIVENGIITWFELDAIGFCEKSSAENVLRNL